MEEKKLTQQESLDIISRMINETRNNLERGGGNIFLLWGYLWLFVSLAVYFVISASGDYRAQWLWFLIPLIGYPGMTLLLKKRTGTAVTFASSFIAKIWIVIGVCALLLSLFMLINPFAFPMLFVMALLINAGVAISGLVIRFKPVIIAGFSGIILSFLLLLIGGFEQILVFAAFSVVMLIIPGHILNISSRKHKI